MAVVYMINVWSKLWPMKTRTIAMMLTLLVAGLVIGCGQSIGEDVERFYPNVDSDCPRCDLKGIDLQGANLTGANLVDAYLYGADLTGANLTGADLSFALLNRANLTEANLTGANLEEVYLSDVIGADLTGAINVPEKYKHRRRCDSI